MTAAEPAPEPAEQEVHEAEVVDHPSKDLAERPAHESALDRAAEAALAMPGIPGKDEFLTLAMTAKMLSLSGAAPKLVRNNPYVAFHVAMVGRDLGISPSAALNLIDVIDSRNGPQLSLSPELQVALLHRQGIGDVRVVVSEVDRAVAVAVAPGGEIDLRCAAGWPTHVQGCRCHGLLGQSEFTWEDARMATLVGPNCQPGDHKEETKTRQGGGTYKACGCNQGYKTYPRRMFRWRSVGFAISDFFPEVGVGLYSPEELGAVVDADGRAIDPTTVDLPDGFGPRAVEPPAEASDEDKAELRRRIEALPEKGREAVREQVLATRGREGVAPLISLDKLIVAQVPRWKALVAAVEARAKAGEFGEWKPPADPETGELKPQDVPDAPQPAQQSETPPEAQEPETAPESATEPAQTAKETADAVDETIEAVRAMTDGAVAAALQKLGLDGGDHPRRVLAERLVQERRADEPDAVPEGALPTPEQVGEMSSELLVEWLTTLGMPTTGKDSTRRTRLLQHLVEREKSLL